MAVCFVDVETSGLDPDRHEIWEVGLITPDRVEYHWFLPIDESRADLIALNIGGYFDRFDWAKVRLERKGVPASPRQEFAREFQKLTRGHHLAGAVVSFDADRLHRLLMANGCIPAWHYHLIDVEALAVGYLVNAAKESLLAAGGESALAQGVLDSCAPPWNSGWLAGALGVDPDQFERHTALGDARWAKAIYEAVMGS